MNEYEKIRLKTENMLSNQAPRLPLCICIDGSFSMTLKGRMTKINKGVRKMISDIKKDPYARDIVELSIVCFGGNHIDIINEFSLVEDCKYRDIVPKGDTPLGEAVEYSLNQLDKQLDIFDDVGIEHYKPWMILISDGKASDDCKQAARKIIDKQKRNKLKVFAIAMGDEENDLSQFTVDGNVLKLDDLKVDSFFQWLSQSMSKQSQSTTNQEEMIDVDEWII